MEPTLDRISLFREFERRFRKPRAYPAPPAASLLAAADVDAAERELSCRLPNAYREFVTEVGACEVRGLSDAWLFNRQADVPVPFDALWPPRDIVRQCDHEWLAPIPSEITGGAAVTSDVAWKYLLPFAGDAGGNWFCFRRQSVEVDDAPVYYFDHDGGDIERIATGLEELIRRYLQIPIS